MKFDCIEPDDFISSVQRINPEIDHEILKQACLYARKAHKGQTRKSGEQFLIHPVNVSFILATMNMDTPSLVAGLLHDVLEDTEYQRKDIINTFGDEIAQLVDGVTKIEKYTYKSSDKRQKLQAENYRKLLISITKDIRIIIIKLADRLHNMRTLEFLNENKRLRIARETMDIYAPLANRFGLAKIQWELEDLSFKILHPLEYRKIVKLVTLKKHEREGYLNRIKNNFRKILTDNKIKGEISGRSKHFYSIYRKNKIKGIKLDEILDLMGLRIIVESIEDCYKILGIIQTKFSYLENSFKDYIAKAKSNNYSSLHIIVLDKRNHKIEVQIRTKEMHLIAEEGIAAHWQYKELNYRKFFNRKGEVIIDKVQNSFDKQLIWIRSLLQNQKSFDSLSFLDSLKLNLYPDIIVVRTPENEYIKLRKHSTPLDFAFKVHSEVGFHCIGALINGKHKTIRAELKSGDVVKILTSPQAKPSRDWIKILKSAKARQKVRSHFRMVDLQEDVQLGKELFYKRIRKLPVKFKHEQDIIKLARSLKYNDLRTFFAELGKGSLDFQEIKDVLFPEEKDLLIDKIKETEEKPDKISEFSTSFPGKVSISLEDIENVMVRFAKCCNPRPGDPILGYTTRGRGITIHRENCRNPGFRNLMRKEPERISRVSWIIKKRISDSD